MSEDKEGFYDLLDSDPERIDVAKLSILAVNEWEQDKELHVRMIRMMMSDARESIAAIEDLKHGEREPLERAVHYFKGSADVVRADRLASACKLALRMVRLNRLAEARRVIPDIRLRFEELEQELADSGYLD